MTLSFLGVANTVLGGGSSTYGVDLIAPLTTAVAGAFASGSVTTFAQQHLVPAAA